MSDLSVRLGCPAYGDGLALLLCDADGKALPAQRRVVVNSAINDVVTVTVEFVVGPHLRIVGDALGIVKSGAEPPPPPKDW